MSRYKQSSSNAKYHYSYLFLYKINKGDLHLIKSHNSPIMALALMYSCVFWCEFIDLVGFFWLLSFDSCHSL